MNSRVLTWGAFAMAFGAGVLVGRALTLMQYEKHYKTDVEAEVESVRVYYAKRAKQGEYADPTNLPEKVKEMPEGDIVYGGRSPIEPLVDQEDWEQYARFDYKKEIPKRSPDVPYVISLDEYIENEHEYDQVSVTYYVVDDVLVGDRNNPIDDILGTIGPVALDQFGHGSKDPNLVYVRNEGLDMDFEVCRDPGSFEDDILGAHVKHSYTRKIPKFRLDDE